MQVKLNIEGMNCVSCAKGIESAIKRIEGVVEADVNYASSQATVTVDDSVHYDKIIHAVHDAGYHAEVISDENGGHAHHLKDTNVQKHLKRFLVSALFTSPLFLQMFWMHLGLFGEISGWVQAILASVVQFGCGWRFYVSSYHSLKVRSANMDVLIALGTSAAYFFSLAVLIFGIEEHLYFESSAMIITLVLFGRWLESITKGRASEAIKKLFEMQPKTAKVKRDGEYVEIPVEEMVVGDHFLVRPGESVPVDGVVFEGSSSVDESMLTGESIPIPKEKDDKIYAATNNKRGVLKAKAIKVGSETALAGIIHLVERAQNSRAPIQKFADRISEVFVPVVIFISIVTFLLWWGLTGGITTALINSVAVLVIACPCALGLATPTVIMVASGKGASLGIFFREAEALERAEKLNTIVLDKTGTVTQGKPEVTDVVPMNGYSPDELLRIAYSLENNSQHPLAGAIIQYSQQKNIDLENTKRFVSHSGKGVSADIDGKTYHLGSMKLVEEAGLLLPDDIIAPLENEGKTICVVWSEKEVMGAIAIADKIREYSAVAVEKLKKRGVHPLMLTGDHSKTAAAIAKQAGIEEYYADVLPENKAEKINQLKDKNKLVGMVGDGINDAPALVAADVGFAIGAGSDVAIEASDITLVRNDLRSVDEAIQLSQATFRKIRQNLFFAFIYNSLGIPLAAIGFLNPIIAAAAMAMSSVSVISNALLLRRWTPS